MKIYEKHRGEDGRSWFCFLYFVRMLHFRYVHGYGLRTMVYDPHWYSVLVLSVTANIGQSIRVLWSRWKCGSMVGNCGACIPSFTWTSCFIYSNGYTISFRIIGCCLNSVVWTWPMSHGNHCPSFTELCCLSIPIANQVTLKTFLFIGFGKDKKPS